MKITTILLVAFNISVSAATFAQNINLSERNTKLADVLKAIRQQSGTDIVYKTDDISGKTININIKSATLEQALKATLEGQHLTYTIQDGTVIIKAEEEPTFLDRVKAAFAEMTVRGKVVDETGAPLVGGTVKVKNNTATATDANGNFAITVADENTVIVFSFIGYETLEITAKDMPKNGVIALKPTQTNLQEVVVSKGYYSVKQRENTGSVSVVTGDDIRKQPVADPIMALEGRVPGMYIAQTSGMPGAAFTIQLRGKNSIAGGNNPLYIVDGVPFNSNTLSSPYMIYGGALGSPIGPGDYATGTGNVGLSPFNSLNPSDIESIEVLKDADATAIYGSRGSNGVVLITTRKGRNGRTKVDLNIFSGVGQVTRKLSLLNTQQYLALRHEGFDNDGIEPGPYDYDVNGTWDTTRYTDWQKELIGGTARFTNAQASVSGGNTNTQFLIGGGYGKQTTVFPGSYSDEKASVNFNINHTSDNQRFKTYFSGQYVKNNNLLPLLDFTSYIKSAPNAPAPYDANGNLNFENGTFDNPYASLLAKSVAQTDNLIGNLNLSYEIIPGLQIKSSFGYTQTELNQSVQQPAAMYYGPADPNMRANSYSTNRLHSWIIEPQVSYNKQLGRGRLDALVGSTVQRKTQAVDGYYANNFLSDALIPNIGAAGSIFLVGNNYTEYRYNALFGRVGYNWDGKYIINLTGRRDGSSRFGPGKQFGNFGAVGAGWIFSHEKFVQDALPFLSFGKLRGSYGTTGNDQILDYQYLSSYSVSSSIPYLNTTTISPSRIANPYFGWEVVKKLEGGIELGFLKDRINLSASYYRNRTGNQLVGYSLPSIDGFTTIQYNLPAVVQNTGVELVLNTTNIKTDHLTWSTSINLSIPRNKLVSYPGLATSSYVNAYVVGKPLFIQKTYNGLGVDPQTGLYRFEDVNKDGSISDLDQQFNKQIAQHFFGGFQNQVSYKGWQLDIFFQFVKQTGGNYLYYFQQPGYYNENQPIDVLNRWTKPGENTTFQKPSTGADSNTSEAYSRQFSGRGALFVTDASFIRLKNVALSYSFPAEWQKKLHFQNMRIYLQCQNLLTITNYKGLDPESQGLALPPLRMITTGIQLSL